ncbi:MAG: hypothetical protein A2269_00595, partial [Lentisphaerae bacterium RIFOXYA12_FULL_60_10]
HRLLPYAFAIVASTITTITASPRIAVEGSSLVDFGAYPAIEQKQATFTLRNTGDSDLQIRNVRKTCGCATVVTGQTNLPSGATTTIQIDILSNSIAGLFTKNNYVESNDPANRFLCLTVAGNAVPLVHITPSESLYAGRLRLNTPWTQTFSLKSTHTNLVFGAPQTESTYPVNVTLDPTQAGRASLSISLIPTKISGDLKCRVTIPVSSPTNHPPVNVSVTGKIGAELAILPEILYLPVSEAPISRTFQLKLLGQRTRSLEPSEVTLSAPKDIQYQIGEKDGQHGVNLSIKFSPEFCRQLMAEETISLDIRVPQAASTTLTLKTKGKKSPLAP